MNEVLHVLEMNEVLHVLEMKYFIQELFGHFLLHLVHLLHLLHVVHLLRLLHVVHLLHLVHFIHYISYKNINVLIFAYFWYVISKTFVRLLVLVMQLGPDMYIPHSFVILHRHPTS